MNQPVTPASVPTTDQPPPLKANPVFRRLLFAQLVSQLGSAVSMVALPMLAVLTLHAAPFQVGLITTFQTAASLVIILFAGAYVDRVRRRPVMIWADRGRALLTGVIVAMALLHMLHMWHIYVIAVFLGVLTVFFETAHGAYLPTVVDDNQIGRAIGTLRSRSAVMDMLGQSTAGFIVQAIGAPLALLVDAASFLVSALGIRSIRQPEAELEPEESMIRQVRTGFRVAFRDEFLAKILGFPTLANLLIAGQTALAVPYLLHLGASPILVGVLLACDSAGAALGFWLGPRLADQFKAGPVIMVASALEVAFNILIPLTRPGWWLGLFAIGMFVANLSVAALSNIVRTYRLRRIPYRQMGSVGATLQLFILGSLPVGALLATLLAAGLGLHAAMWWLWGLMLPALGFVYWAKAWRLDLATVTRLEPSRASEQSAA
jgi:MFS family permease